MNHPAVAALLDHYAWGGSPEELMRHLCEDLLAQAGPSVPVDVRVLASLRGARVEEAEQQLAGWIGPAEGRLVIRVRASDLEPRRRFTICHEVCHTFFPDFCSSPRGRLDTRVGHFDEEDPVEFLCDFGAAELLLPRADFLTVLPARFDIDDIILLSNRFKASIEATARRAVGLSEEPVAAVMLEAEPGGGVDDLVTQWCEVNSCMDGSPAWRSKGHLERLAVEASRGRALPEQFSFESRDLPYAREDATVPRVLTILRPKSPR